MQIEAVAQKWPAKRCFYKCRKVHRKAPVPEPPPVAASIQICSHQGRFVCEMEWALFKCLFWYANDSVLKLMISRGESRVAATSKMEHFMKIVNGWKPLTVITKHSILDVTAALDPPLISITRKVSLWDRPCCCNMLNYDADKIPKSYNNIYWFSVIDRKNRGWLLLQTLNLVTEVKSKSSIFKQIAWRFLKLLKFFNRIDGSILSLNVKQFERRTLFFL